MLSPRLMQVKVRIEGKRDALRTTDERELLSELQRLDTQVSKMSVEFRESINANLVTSGPGDKCPCCGR